MDTSNRRQSSFPDRGEAVQRQRGLGRWKHSLNGIKSTLERLEAAQAEAKARAEVSNRASAQSKPKPKRTKNKKKSGGVFRKLIFIGVFIYIFSNFSEHFDDILSELGDLESVISGGGDQIVEEMMRQASPPPEPEAPARPAPIQAPPAAAPRAQITPAAPPTERTSRVTERAAPPPPEPMPQTDGKIPLVGELPRYTGSENVFEDETVAVYATADPVPQVAEITLKLLEKDGWRGKVTAQDASMRHLTFRRGRLKLTAYISVAKGLGNRTAIQYHLVQL